MSARIEYAPGEAWCIATDRVVLVCERDLTPARARALHEAAAEVESTAALQELVATEATALIALVDLDGARALLRRHGVPATAGDAPLPDRFGEAWSVDETSAEQSIDAGGLGALTGDLLPLEGGVARVAAVRVAPRPVDASADVVQDALVASDAAAPAMGAFGQTLPPAAAAEARAPRADAVPAPEAAPDAELEPAPEAVPEPEPVPEPTPDPEPVPEATPGPQPTPEPAPASAPASDPAPDPAADPEPATTSSNPIGSLIDSVPGFIKPAVDVRAFGESAPAPQAVPEPVAPAAPEPPTASAPAPAVPAVAEPAGGDHDGMTITADRARELLAERQAQEPAGPPATGPLVLSTLCPSGHVNAPGSAQCFQCGARIDEGSTGQRRRPEVAVAVLPSGDRVPLGRGVIIGRRPRSRRVEDGRVPRLVTVESPSEDISRSHLELRVEDWNLVAVDLSSTNGTLLLREGSAPQRLRPEASTILQLGDRLDLGDGVVVVIEPAS